MMKLAILDKDGSLVQPASGAAFPQSPTDQVLLPGVESAVALLVADGYTLVIASNQGGVEAGHKTLEGTIAEMRYCMSLLPAIKTAFFCPDFAGNQCYEVWQNSVFEAHQKGSAHEQKLIGLFRKPCPGMLKLAITSMGGMIDLAEPDAKQSFLMIGDMDSDEQSAVAAGILFIDAAKWRRGVLV